jgi:hypothetical protein
VPHILFTLLLVTFSSVFLGAQQMGQISGESLLDRTAAVSRSALTCSEPVAIRVPPTILERAKLKARLLNLLRESLNDDAKGIVNMARENEIRKLAVKLKNDWRN